MKMKKSYKEPKLNIINLTDSLLAGSNPGFADGYALEGDAKRTSFQEDEDAWDN